jgi:hypothetical protein
MSMFRYLIYLNTFFMFNIGACNFTGLDRECKTAKHKKQNKVHNSYFSTLHL